MFVTTDFNEASTLLDLLTMPPDGMLSLQLLTEVQYFLLPSNLGLLSLPSPRRLRAEGLAY